uniref:Uncharacterized protein n=1 Tax=Aedes aegypti TaxID=7159 RepID=A0A903VVA8_AEDAE
MFTHLVPTIPLRIVSKSCAMKRKLRIIVAMKACRYPENYEPYNGPNPLIKIRM